MHPKFANDLFLDILDILHLTSYSSWIALILFMVLFLCDSSLQNSLSSLHIFVHHCTFCASLHVKTSPDRYDEKNRRRWFLKRQNRKIGVPETHVAVYCERASSSRLMDRQHRGLYYTMDC